MALNMLIKIIYSQINVLNNKNERSLKVFYKCLSSNNPLAICVDKFYWNL